jgi:predicted P-loop ATPase
MSFAEFLLGADKGAESPQEKPASDEPNPFKEANAVDPHEVLGWLGVPVDGDRILSCPGCGANGSDSSVAFVRGGWKCQHSSCGSKGHPKNPGFRTNVDSVAEIRGVSTKAAIGLISEQFGTTPLGGRAHAAPDGQKVRVQEAIGFIVNTKGSPRACVANVLTALIESELWRGVVVYDEFREAIVVTRQPPARHCDAPKTRETTAWTDVDDVRTCAWLSSAFGLHVPIQMVRPAIEALAQKQRVHPVREYLRGLKWDGVVRLPMWLPTCLGTDQTPYTEAVGVRYLISAVARVMRPGCKVDTMLVLEGVQGARKSTIPQTLVGNPNWFSDTHLRFGDKDGYQNLRGKWIYELAELSSMKSFRDIERIKGFLAAATDTYRPSYGRSSVDFPRQTVFIGTTNEATYLVDPTGNRRFWPIKCGKVDLCALERDREQLWAETVVRFDQGERWYIDSEDLSDLCSAEQEARVLEEPWDTIVTRWFDQPTVPRNRDFGERELVDLEAGLTTLDVLVGALDLRRGEIERKHTQRIGDVLRRLGFDRRRVRLQADWTKREWRYFPPSFGAPSPSSSDNGDAPGDAIPEPKTPNVPNVPNVPNSSSVRVEQKANQGGLAKSLRSDDRRDMLEVRSELGTWGRSESPVDPATEALDTPNDEPAPEWVWIGTAGEA